MNAYVLRKYGQDARFELADIPKPLVKPGHVVLEVKATSMNPVDFKVRVNGPRFAPELPAVLHGDVAGIVKEVASDVSDFSPGDEVYGCVGGVRGQGGALAEYMIADAQLLAPKPRNLDFRQAATLPLVSITAYEGLIDRARVKAGQRVLIHGAAGGVGHVAIQLAKIAGTKVYATASNEEKAQIGRRFGAEEIIFYHKETPEEYVKRLTNGEGFDIVFDTIGGENVDCSLKAAATNGQVITIVSYSTHDLSIMHQRGLTLHVVFMLLPMLTGKGRSRHGEILRDVSHWVEQGKISPLLDSTHFSMAQVNEAHAHYATGRFIGKIAIEQV